MISSGIARLKDAFANSRFAHPESAARHVSIIAGGTVIAQAVGILTMPIVSRIYSPADYGIMALYASVIAILGEVSGFSYHFAIPLPKRERYAKALVILSMGLQLTFASFLTLILLFTGNFLLTKLSMTSLIPYKLLIPIGLFTTGVYVVLTQWAIREKLFSDIGRTKITQSLSGAFAKIALGLLGVRPLGLLIGTIIAQGGGISTLLRSLVRKKGIPWTEKKNMRRVALRYRNFPLFGTWADLVNTVGFQIVPLLLVVFFNTKTAGLFAMGQRLLSLPADFVGKAIGQVFVQRASVANNTGGLETLSLRTFELLLRIGFFPLLLISFFGPVVFSIVIGESWHGAGVYARFLGPWAAFAFAYSPMTVLYVIQDRQKVFLYFEMIHLLLKVLALCIARFYANPLLSIVLVSVFGLTTSIIRAIELLTFTGTSAKKVVYVIFAVLSESLLLVSIPVLLYVNSVNSYFIAISLLASFFVYARRCWSIVGAFL